MAASSDIEWTDATWNPTIGCRSVSPGCLNCYAETMSVRQAGMSKAKTLKGGKPDRSSNYLHVIQDGGWKGNVRCVPEALTDPFKWKKPRKVFVNSMSDLFYGDDADRRFCEAKGIPFEPVPFEFIDRVFSVMALTPQHTYQILTKRTARMADYVERTGKSINFLEVAARELGYTLQYEMPSGEKIGLCNWPLSNVHLGTSVENQKTADDRLPQLRRCKAAVLFLSCEPLLGPLEFSDASRRSDALAVLGKTALFGIGWVIVGGESGHGARPCGVHWIRSIVKQCKAASVPVFVKQLGANPCMEFADGAIGERIRLKDSKGGDWNEWVEDLRVREMPKPLEVANA